MCARAHMFDHDCAPAPKPWLSPPVGLPPPAPKELGEEGFLGFLPWHLIKYAGAVGALYGVLFLWRAFQHFRADQAPELGVLAALWLALGTLLQHAAGIIRHRLALHQPGSDAAAAVAASALADSAWRECPAGASAADGACVA